LSLSSIVCCAFMPVNHESERTGLFESCLRRDSWDIVPLPMIYHRAGNHSIFRQDLRVRCTFCNLFCCCKRRFSLPTIVYIACSFPILVAAHLRRIARSKLYRCRKRSRHASCMSSDLEKDNVMRTKRARRCRSVVFQRSTWAVSPISFPTAVCCSCGITAAYVAQKSVKQCP